MKSTLNHLQINIDFKNLSFYKELMSFLGWSIIIEADEVVGYTSGAQCDVWYFRTDNAEEANSDRRGVSHIGFEVEHQLDVDEVTEFLSKYVIKPLYDTPRHRPEFSEAPKTYYQVMFETPDKVLMEVLYLGEKE